MNASAHLKSATLEQLRQAEFEIQQQIDHEVAMVVERSSVAGNLDQQVALRSEIKKQIGELTVGRLMT